MFNRMILCTAILACGNTILGEGTSSKQLSCIIHSIIPEINPHRMSQSTFMSNPRAIQQDRHRFILNRLGKDKSLGSKKSRQIQVVSPEQLVPKLPEEPSQYSMRVAAEEESANTPKFKWTMMPPVKSSISQRFGTGEPKFAQGIVYKINSEQVVHAPIAGEVIFSGAMKEFEHVIMIEKDLENVILVAGISNSSIKSGDKVFRGQKIGAVIKGGWIYVEFRNAGNSIDPQKVLASGSVNEE